MGLQTYPHGCTDWLDKFLGEQNISLLQIHCSEWSNTKMFPFCSCNNSTLIVGCKFDHRSFLSPFNLVSSQLTLYHTVQFYSKWPFTINYLIDQTTYETLYLTKFTKNPLPNNNPLPKWHVAKWPFTIMTKCTVLLTDQSRPCLPRAGNRGSVLAGNPWRST